MKIAINCKKLSSKQCVCLIKLRLLNIGDKDFTKITIEEDTVTKEGFTAIIQHKIWDDYRTGMIIDKLFLDEVEYLFTENVLDYSYIVGGKSTIEINEEYRR